MFNKQCLLKTLNFILFYIGWFILVYFRNAEATWLCAGICCLNFILGSPKTALIKVALITASFGLFHDALLVHYYFFSFTDTPHLMLPTWFITLWVLFLSTYHCSLAWILKLPIIITALLGGIFGSLSYMAGTWMGALTFHFDTMPQALFHFIDWAILFPMTIVIYNKLRNLTC